MPIRPCPHCQCDTLRVLEDSSKESEVWYYRCLKCGHSWWLPVPGR